MQQLVVGSYAPQLYQANQNLDLLATAYHKGIAKRMAKMVADAPQLAELHGLFQQLNANALPTSARCWQPELGAVTACLSNRQLEAAVIHALLAMHALGAGAHWGHLLRQPLRVAIAGHLFDLDGAFSLHADSAQIRVQRHDSGLQPLVLDWRDGAWRLAGSQAPQPGWQYSAPLFLQHPGFSGVYLQSYVEPSAADVPEMIIDWPVPLLHGADARWAERAAPQVADAMRILDDTDPCYLQWVQPLFRGMGPGPLVDGNTRQSGSFSWHPGLFSCGFPLSTPYLAEVIVHEMSHQHFMLADAVVPLIQKGRNEEIYFSTFKGKHRNLEKILLTFHACANMVLFWHDFITRSGDREPRNREQMELMLFHTRGLVKILDTTTDLTEAGTGMYRAQCELLRARGLSLS